ncbi:MAG: energy-coupling factor transporter ATPase [Oscillospiraceae bacterium]|nr:energy-coupling factor transporter ATPase [Oscillospiraceae bacterium]
MTNSTKRATGAGSGENLITLSEVTFSYNYMRETTDGGEAANYADYAAAKAETPNAETVKVATSNGETVKAETLNTETAKAVTANTAGGQGNIMEPGAGVYDRDKAVEDVSLCIERGEFIVFLGRNGSGKSTLAKLLNALLIPDSGVVTVKGMNTSDPENVWEIRRSSGMVFQNPDNQIVGTTVEEDVAFGVENIGVPPLEIRRRIDMSMAETGVLEFAQRPPYQLSGGQKQRVAIAGILAMKPECVILDEATSMLDPDGRREVIKLVRKLNEEENIAVILITHHMDEAAHADRVFVVDDGRVVISRPPRELFGDSALIRSIGLDVPQITEIFDILRERGFTELPAGVTGADEAYAAIMRLLSAGVGTADYTDDAH